MKEITLKVSEDLYDECCAVLTNYENDEADVMSADLYHVLVKLMNSVEN